MNKGARDESKINIILINQPMTTDMMMQCSDNASYLMTYFPFNIGLFAVDEDIQRGSHSCRMITTICLSLRTQIHIMSTDESLCLS